MSKAEAEPDVKSIEVAPGQTLHLRCDWGVGIGGGLWTTGEHLCAHFREPALSYARWLDGRRVLDCRRRRGGGHELIEQGLRDVLEACAEQVPRRRLGLECICSHLVPSWAKSPTCK